MNSLIDRDVLIIEDDPETQNFLGAMAREAASSVRIVSRGSDGIAAARTARPDLILCGVAMPAMSGFEIRRAFARDALLAAVPFIFISSHGRVDEQLTGLRLGAVDYLVKPVHRDTLLARIAFHLQRQGSGLAILPQRDAVSDTTVVSGSLEALPIADLLHVIDSRRSSGLLTLRSGAVTGKMLIHQGRLLYAETNARSGEDAAMRLVWLVRGSFRFEQQEVPATPGAEEGRPLVELLLDAAWLHDELARLGPKAPGVDDLFTLAKPARARELFSNNPRWHQLVDEGVEPLSIQAVADYLDISTYRCRVVVGSAAERSIVEVLEAASVPRR